uniref:Uncharacterized protein n=1 Tax=Candidatus Kentrum sp. FM TaxID=2126340 RepID=A0A450TW99_9GAMM|nr:MAG: hypothetical protein BECKFM1743A_GA0114220_107072 [Candidatus Kentron sp. FM]
MNSLGILRGCEKTSVYCGGPRIASGGVAKSQKSRHVACYTPRFLTLCALPDTSGQFCYNRASLRPRDFFTASEKKEAGLSFFHSYRFKEKALIGHIFSLGEGKPGIRFYERFRVKASPPVGWNRRALLTFVFFAIRPHAVFHA